MGRRAAALLCVLNLLRQAPLHPFAQQTDRFSPAWATSMATRMGLELQVEARATEPVPNQTEAANDRWPAQTTAGALPAASGAPVLLLLQIPGCESERLGQQLPMRSELVAIVLGRTRPHTGARLHQIRFGQVPQLLRVCHARSEGRLCPTRASGCSGLQAQCAETLHTSPVAPTRRR